MLEKMEYMLLVSVMTLPRRENPDNIKKNFTDYKASLRAVNQTMKCINFLRKFL